MHLNYQESAGKKLVNHCCVMYCSYTLKENLGHPFSKRNGSGLFTSY